MIEGGFRRAREAAAVMGAVVFASWPSVVSADAPQSAVVHVYAEDAASAPIAAQLADAMVKRANGSGRWRATTDRTVGELLERAPDDLARWADALVRARAAYSEALDHNTRLRLELAQETLLKARASYLEAVVSPVYEDLRNVHLYQGMILFNQGHPDAATQQFRQTLFLSPQLVLNREVFSPSIVSAFELAKRGVAAGPKGAIRIDCETPGCVVALNGLPRGSSKLLSEIPEGEHYLEFRAPGAVPQLQAIQVSANAETPVVVTLRKAGATLKSVWGTGKGENGGAAIAKILRADRLVLASVRSTVAGMLPFTARAAVFEAGTGRRFSDAETGLSGANDTRVPRFIDGLFSKPQVNVAGRAAIVAARARFLERDSASVMLEAGTAFQNKVYDEKGRYVASDSWGEFERSSPDQDFDSYSETRTVVHVRYGVRERATAFVSIPFYTKSLRYTYDANDNGTIEGGEDNTRRKASGVGDVQMGVDIRIPRFEIGPLSMVYASTRVELPTGSSVETCGFIRRYCTLVIGSGQWDVYAGLGGFIARDDFRFGFELGYNARLPDRVWYYNEPRPHRHLDIGDEQKLHLDGSMHLASWVASELFLDFTRRNATEKFIDPITHDFGKAPEMLLLDLGAAVRADFSERTRGGFVLSHPIFGKSTMTFFPLDVTGPRAYLYYGYRF